MTTSLVFTVVGSDQPGVVNLLSDVAQRSGANWAASRMASLAGQFAGIVHFEVPDQNAEPLASALPRTRFLGTARRHRNGRLERRASRAADRQA